MADPRVAERGRLKRQRGRAMAGGLAGRLADFFSALAGAVRRPAARRAMPVDDRRRLAVELLGTIGAEVLVETGYKRKRTAARAAAQHHRRRLPSPPPVGDLARPRLRD
jgi:hypothetical protein